MVRVRIRVLSRSFVAMQVSLLSLEIADLSVIEKGEQDQMTHLATRILHSGFRRIFRRMPRSSVIGIEGQEAP